MPAEKRNRSLLFEDLKQLDKWLFSKKTFISIFSIGLIIFLKPLFEHLINQFLVSKESSSSAMMDVAVIFIGLFMFSFGIYKFRLKYQPSYNHILMILLGVLAYSSFRFGEHSFNYDKFMWNKLSSIYYLDFLVITSSFFPFLNSLLAQTKSFKKYKKIESTSTNTYFEDRPINQNQQNEHLVKEICDAICSNEFLGSFSIGVMGTWGHGKSSFIQALKHRLKSTEEANGIIEINFSPFLNHKEEDLISDFFKSFSNQLSRYSGQLSQSLIEYAGSITKFYKRGEITDLLSNISIASGNPAFELYNNVNDLIGKTERKIVVYIDDLDRLSSKEILQIFKLIRNTSNFKNTFFILALDKTYVVNALAADKSFMESNFIDKFFQLEVFLPEINEIELATYLSDLLIKSKKFNADQISTILKPIREQETLFGNYIKNYRDCIRLTNQIIFDHSVLENLIAEVSVIDTLNLIFLRTRFPQIFNELHQNRRRFLIEDTSCLLYTSPSPRD
nr:P-loop NTPase fold protein [uncultured Fluviicola sp.]